MFKKPTRSESSNNVERQFIPPRFIKKGRQEVATYHEQEVPEYRDNPLIEALPAIWTRDEVVERLLHLPPYSEDQRTLPDHIRLHLIENSREFFIPQGIHLEIEIRISCMIRRGYQHRNPMTFGYWPDLARRLDAFKSDDLRSLLQSKARGFATVGYGGIGKTKAIENILMQYPQVINHSKYQERDYIQKQLVWLMLDCPQDGSIKGLCKNFFELVDDILGTHYYVNYAAGRSNTVDVLLPRMARVAALHSLGVLVIDEIQDLSASKSGGAAQMLNFFVQLENSIGVPYILVGTPKALPLFAGEFRQARRASEQGDVIWKRMCEFAGPDLTDRDGKTNPVWEEFVRSLFAYDYLRKPSSLKANLLRDPLSRALYYESQGITALAVTIYLLAQRRAITSGEDELSPDIIHQVAKDSQYLVRPMLDQLREGAEKSPYIIEDLYDVDKKRSSTRRKAHPESARAAEEVQSKASSPIRTDLRTDLGQPNLSSTKKRSGPGAKRKGALKGTAQSYDDDDLRKLHGQSDTGSVSSIQAFPLIKT